MTLHWYFTSRGVWLSTCHRFAIVRKPETGQWHLFDREQEIGGYDSLPDAKSRATDSIALAWTDAAAMVEARR